MGQLLLPSQMLWQEVGSLEEQPGVELALSTGDDSVVRHSLVHCDTRLSLLDLLQHLLSTSLTGLLPADLQFSLTAEYIHRIINVRFLRSSNSNHETVTHEGYQGLKTSTLNYVSLFNHKIRR